MTTKSLLSHVAFHFPGQENLATESLVYIIGQSPVAKRAVLSFIDHNLGVKFPESVVFHAQKSGADGSIPDIIGSTSDGKRVVIMEVKFWAGLTDNQPVSYLKQLPLGEPAVLLFVAPEKRLTILWDHILEQCTRAGLELGVTTDRLSGSELKFQKIGACHLLALTSWRALLAHIDHALNVDGDITARADLHQLQGLCDRMDEEAFLPLRSEELTGTIAARLLQFSQLVEDIVSSAVKEGLVITNGNRTWSGATYWSPLKIHTFNCYLQMSLPHWKWFRSTPIWLSVADSQWKVTQVVKDALSPLEHEEPRGVINDDEGKPLVPLTLPLGVERPIVLEALLVQLRKVAALLGHYCNSHGLGINK